MPRTTQTMNERRSYGGCTEHTMLVKVHRNFAYLWAQYPSTTENWNSTRVCCCMFATHAGSPAATTDLPSIHLHRLACTLWTILSPLSLSHAYTMAVLTKQTARYGLPRGLTAQFIHGSTIDLFTGNRISFKLTNGSESYAFVVWYLKHVRIKTYIRKKVKLSL
jgi:hypothetical protein